MQKEAAGLGFKLYRALIGEKGKKIVDLIFSRESCSVTNREGEGDAALTSGSQRSAIAKGRAQLPDRERGREGRAAGLRFGRGGGTGS